MTIGQKYIWGVAVLMMSLVYNTKSDTITMSMRLEKLGIDHFQD